MATLHVDKFIYDALGRPHGRKDPDATLDYSFNFTDWLGADTIATITPAIENVTDAGGTITASGHNGKIATVWLSGGTLGKVIKLRCRITTVNSPPRVDDRTMFLKVTDR